MEGRRRIRGRQAEPARRSVSCGPRGNPGRQRRRPAQPRLQGHRQVPVVPRRDARWKYLRLGRGPLPARIRRAGGRGRRLGRSGAAGQGAGRLQAPARRVRGRLEIRLLGPLRPRRSAGSRRAPAVRRTSSRESDAAVAAYRGKPDGSATGGVDTSKAVAGCKAALAARSGGSLADIAVVDTIWGQAGIGVTMTMAGSDKRWSCLAGEVRPCPGPELETPSAPAGQGGRQGIAPGAACATCRIAERSVA